MTKKYIFQNWRVAHIPDSITWQKHDVKLFFQKRIFDHNQKWVSKKILGRQST